MNDEEFKAFQESDEWRNVEDNFNETTVDGLIRESKRQKLMLADVVKAIRKDAKSTDMKMCGIKISIANADAEVVPMLLDQICELAVKKFKLEIIADGLKKHVAMVDEIDDVLHEVKDIEDRDGEIKGGVFGVAAKSIEILERRHKKMDDDSIENN